MRLAAKYTRDFSLPMREVAHALMLARLHFFAALLVAQCAFGHENESVRFSLLADASLSGGGTLVIDSSSEPKEFAWRRYATCGGSGGLLERGERYILRYKARVEAAGEKGKLLVLVRPKDLDSPLLDCAADNVLPTGGGWTVRELKFAVGDRDDYCIQFHSWNRIKAEIAEVSLVKRARMRFEPVEGVQPRVAVDVSAEPRGAEEFDVDMPAPGGGAALNAADFGVAETNADNTAAMRAALAAAKRQGAYILKVPRGVYRFTEDSPLSMEGFTDFTFHGGGSTFVTHRRKGAFLDVAGCTRVRICAFTLDWDWDKTPLASIVEVMSADGRSVELAFTEYDDFPNKNDALFLVASAWDPVARSVGMEGRVTRGFDKIGSTRRMVMVEWTAPNVAKVASTGGGMEKGQQFRLQHFYYHMGGIYMRSNAHLRLERLRVLSTPGHAFRITGTQHHTLFRNVDIVAPPDDPRRVITCTGDHLHLTNSRGHVKLENCEFSLGGDDIFNMHDNAAFAEKIGPATVRTFNAPYFTDVPSGTRIELRNADYSPSGKTLAVAALNRLDGRSAKITFDGEAPGRIGDGFILFDTRYDTRNVIVRGCRFHGNRGRALLIAARDVTVEGNVFRLHEFGAIKLETGYTLNHWSEGYGVSNVVVRNNVFDTVNPAGHPASHLQRSIYAGIYLRTDPSSATTSYPIIRDILFAGNEFRESTGVIAYLSSVKGVTFRDNRFIDAIPRRNELKHRAQFHLEDVRDVKIFNNVWRRSPWVAAPGVEWDPDTCERVEVRGNSLVE